MAIGQLQNMLPKWIKDYLMYGSNYNKIAKCKTILLLASNDAELVDQIEKDETPVEQSDEKDKGD